MRNALNIVLRKLGFELERYSVSTSNHKLQQQLILNQHIDLVIDIGANTGQFCEKLRSIGFTGKMISFEPMSAPFEQLKLKASKDKNWEVHNYALGAEEKEAQINISANSYSSSLYESKKELIASVPSTKTVNKEVVKIKKLTDIVPVETLKSYKNIMLKIDVQGYEFNVLNGCMSVLPLIKLIQCEMSFTILYENGKLYNELIDFMKQANFSLYSLIPEFYDEKSGKLLEADGLFINNFIS